MRLKAKRVAVVLFSNYPADPRPRRAAEALVQEGANVEVICLKEEDEEPLHEYVKGVNITRIAVKRHRHRKLSYVIQYATFILISGPILARRTWRQRYDLVHVHNMPDVLVFSALAPKIFKAKVILDLHDPMPELMMTIFGLRENSYLVRLLKELEKWSLRFADAVLTVNETCKRIFSGRGCPPEKISVIMNSPDESIFQCCEPSTPCTQDIVRPWVIMYHGTLVERHGVDLAVAAIEKVRSSIPRVELRIYGRCTPFLEQVMDLVRKSELPEVVRYLGPKKLEVVAEAIRECDIGIIPNRRSTFTELNTPTRILEYLSQGKPVIAPRAPGILEYFGPDDLVFFELGDVNDLAVKIEYAFSHPEEMARMVKRAQKVYSAHKWSCERQQLVSLAERLLDITERPHFNRMFGFHPRKTK